MRKSLLLDHGAAYGWLLCLALFVAIPYQALAQVKGERFADDKGIMYEVTSENPRAVKVIAFPERGDVVVPSEVLSNQNRSFTVDEIGVFFDRSWNGTSLTLPATCKRIQQLGYNPNLSTFEIPRSVFYISQLGLTELPNLESCTVETGSQYFEVKDGVLFGYIEGDLATKGKYLLRFPPKKSLGVDGLYKIPEGVISVAKTAFFQVTALKKLHIPASVNNLNTSFHTDFCQGTSLNEITIDENNQTYSIDNTGTHQGVVYSKDKKTLYLYPKFKTEALYAVDPLCKVIEEKAFQYNHNLKEVTLGSVEQLKFTSFAYMPNLEKITLPLTLEPLNGEIITQSCPKLKISVAKGHPIYIEKDDILYEHDGTAQKTPKNLIYCPLAKVFDKNSFDVPEGIQRIEAYAFKRHPTLEKIKTPSSLTFIGQDAFMQVPLTNIDFSASTQLTEIAGYVFYGCNKLTKVKLPASLTKMSTFSFASCAALTEIIFPDGSQLTTIPSNTFTASNKLKKITFEGSSAMKTLGARAFIGLANLEEISLPKSVTTIEDGAFVGCTGLTKIQFHPEAEILKIGKGAFADCKNVAKIELPKSIRSVGEEAFRNCVGLKELTFGENMKHIDPRAFVGCLGLTKFALTEGAKNTRYSVYKDMLFSFNKDTLLILPAGLAPVGEEPLELPPSIKVIGGYASFSNTNLKKIIIPKRVENIGEKAFAGCNKLTDVSLLSPALSNPANISNGSIELEAFDEDRKAEITLTVPSLDRKKYNEGEVEGAALKQYYRAFKGMKTLTDFSQNVTLIENKNTLQIGRSEYIATSDNSVTLKKVILNSGEQLNTYVIPEKVTVAQTGGLPAKEYYVTAIDDYAFQNANIEEIVIQGEKLKTLGLRAFITMPTPSETPAGMSHGGYYLSNIKRIIFADASFDQLPNNFNHIEYTLAIDPALNKTQKIYLRKSAVVKLKEQPKPWAKSKDWEAYADQISYTIEGVAINNKYATFAREFDVDFDFEGTSDLPGASAVNQNIEVYAGQGREMKGFGDHGSLKTQYKVSFEPIGTKGKKAYVPKNNGVLIKNTSNNTPEKFYYRIGEKASATPIANNVLQGVTFKKQEITKDVSNPAWRYYVLQEGVFRLVPNTYSKFGMNVQKAYLLLKSAAPAGAPDVLSIYEDEDITTGIDAVSADSEAPVYYNLQGVRTTKPSRGLYLRNGKKTFIH